MAGLEARAAVRARGHQGGDDPGVDKGRGGMPERPFGKVHRGTPRWRRFARRPWTADGGPSGLLRNVPPPKPRWPRASEGPERTGKGAETTQPASRMIRPAMTLARDLVRRRHPTGASQKPRNAPGRTLSPMPSEQKGAYGGHLAPSVSTHGGAPCRDPAYVRSPRRSAVLSGIAVPSM